MKNEDLKKHRGEYLNWLVRKKGIKIVVLTRLAGYDRSTFYNHIRDQNLPYAILLKYEKGLNHDFSIDYPDIRGNIGEDMPEISTYEEMKIDRDKWKHKYDAITELFNKFMEERNSRDSSGK